MKKCLVRILVYVCTVGLTAVGSVQAQNTTSAYYPRANVQFESALNAEELAHEMLLNVETDHLQKANRVKVDATTKATVNIFGSVSNNFGSPICGLILANGQFMFSCSPNGTYSLDVPQDGSGQVTLFGFADGHFPYKSVFSGFGGRRDMTLNYATVAPPPPPPPPVYSTSVITFSLTDGCNNGIPIDYKFYDETNNLVWPSSSTHYSTVAYNGTYTHNLTCRTNANVCFGARSQYFYWGVDVDNSKSCADCCINCQQAYSLTRRLTC